MNVRVALRRLTGRLRPAGPGPRALTALFSLAWRSDPVGAIQVFGSAAALGIAPAIQVHLTVGLTASLLASVASGRVGGPAVLTYLAVISGVSVISQLLSAVQGRAMQRCQTRLSAAIASQIIRKSVSLSVQQVEDAPVQDALQRAVREVNFRPGMLLQQLTQLATQLVTLTSVATVLLETDVWVAALALLAPVPAIFAQIVAGKRNYRLEYERSADRRRLAYWQRLATMPDSAKEVTAFRLGDHILDAHDRVLESIIHANLKLANKNLLMSLPLMLATAVIILAAQATAVLHGSGPGTIAALMGAIQAIGTLQGSTQQLFTAASGMYVNQLYLRNVLAFINIPVVQLASGTREFPREIKSSLELRGVSFRYPSGQRDVLHEINLVLRPSETTALVGANGAGKSTIAKLVGRLWEPTAGTVCVDGHPLQEYELKSLRERVAYVFQDYVEYQLSVGDNVRFGSLHEAADIDRRVAHAIDDVGLTGQVAALPEGAGTQAGRLFDGVEFSGGQWQRIAIARSLIRSASVRIFDEPTASIDPVAESMLLAKLAERAAGRVNIVVAHRWSAIRHADRIVVISDGRVAEDGTHEELLALGGLYAEMYEAQGLGRGSGPENELQVTSAC